MMNKNVFLKTIYCLFVIGIFLCPLIVMAQTGNSGAVFTSAYQKIQTTFHNARNVVYVLSGFGLVGVAAAAIFGKMNFTWLAMICIALATLAAADKIVAYSINNGVSIDEAYRGIGEDDFDLYLQFEN
ncbi:MAG: TrbC/VirB2 family protein [Alphaproteobacteria bacterium]